MTLDFLRDEIYQQIGEPSDLDPDTDTQYNSGPLLTWVVNEGLRNVATWVDPRTGRSVRLPDLIGDTLFQPYYTSGTLTDAGTTSTVVLPSGASTVDDAYNNWVITVDGETRVIVDYVGSTLTATVHDTFGSAPAVDDTYELSKNFVELLESTDSLVSYHLEKPSNGSHTGNFLFPLKIVDLEDQRSLVKAGANEDYATLLSTTGTPTEWYWISNKLVFNYAPDESRWFKMEYYRLPRELSSATDEPDIPEFMQYGVVLWGRWWGYARQQGQPEAYAAKKDYEDFMHQRLNLYAIEYLRDDDHGLLVME